MSNRKFFRYVESLKHAVWYYKRLGFTVIPVAVGEDGKRVPLVKWGVYRERKITEDEVVDLFSKYRGANISVVLGRPSGVVVIDLDEERIPPFLEKIKTWIVKTKRGFHYYFHCEGEYIESACLENNVELKAEGSLCTLPRSYHHLDAEFRYEWLIPPYYKKDEKTVSMNKLAGFSEVRDKLAVYFAKKMAKVPISFLYKGVPEGKRNVSLVRIAGSLFSDGLSYDEVLSILLVINESNSPPLPYREVVSVAKSIYKREQRKRKIAASYRYKLFDAISCNGFKEKLSKVIEDVCEELKRAGFSDKDVFFFLKSISLQDVANRIFAKKGG